MEDREGNIWTGGLNRGMNAYRDAVFQTVSEEDDLSGSRIYRIHEDVEGVLWTIDIEQNLKCVTDGKYDDFFHWSEKIHTLYSNKDGGLLLGGNNGIKIYKNKEWTSLAEDMVVYSVFNDDEERIWINSSNSFNDEPTIKYSTDNGFKVLKDSAGNAIMHATNIIEDRKGCIWISTYGSGVYRSCKGVVNTFSVKNGLSSNTIQSIYEDSDGNIWLGGWGGITLYKDSTFFNFTDKEGLPQSSVFVIVEDDYGNFWCSNSQGIFRVEKKQLINVAAGKQDVVSAVSYDEDDGMKSRECFGGGQPVATKRKDGTIWFPTIRGVAAVDPADLKSNNLPPPVYIEEFIQDGRELKFDKEVRLQPGGDKLEFHYTALSFVKSDKIEFNIYAGRT